MVSTSVSMMLWTLFIMVVVAVLVTMVKKNKKIPILTKPEDNTSYKDAKENTYKKIDKKKPQVYLEIGIDGTNKGRIIIELFDHLVPGTAENFRNLCKGFNKPGSPGQVLHYKGSKFHLINKGLAAQGGDFTSGDGTGGGYATLSGDRFVEVTTDANMGKHAEPYLVSMAMHGEQLAIGSQFFITFSSLPHLDREHVVFGKVVEGFKVLSEMEDVLTTLGKPKVPVVIVECGEIMQEIDAGNNL
uniref:peptidyl-prolyl cis-trans isomerase CYP18-3-like n=1 Tax=Fragaria vesca subsp. vesca TaxID=101020 RepID=UPI0005C99AB2|nr:PREDICTED: peptidyl-prolyl cis-trans isomerase CYP18-3-like [Fragaria vesca subsp. vesca]